MARGPADAWINGMEAERSALDLLPSQPRHRERPGRGLVQRPALFHRLSETRWGGVMLVCAPAGSGKTVLVRSWLEAAGLQDGAAWVSAGSIRRRASGARQP
jgi:ATP/maltotriose-dependent transcriptional regulator MalT